jgi:hypothetical protein
MFLKSLIHLSYCFLQVQNYYCCFDFLNGHSDWIALQAHLKIEPVAKLVVSMLIS